MKLDEQTGTYVKQAVMLILLEQTKVGIINDFKPRGSLEVKKKAIETLRRKVDSEADR